MNTKNTAGSMFRSKSLFKRKAFLVTMVVVYLLGITFLLMLGSPERFLSSLTTAGPSIYLFAKAHQTALHFFSFYLLAFLICLCCRTFRGHLISIALMGLYAVVTEFAQMFLPERHPDLFDLLANLAGIGLGVASVWVLAHIKSRVASRA